MKKRVISSILILLFVLPVTVLSSISTYSNGVDNNLYQVFKYIFAVLLFFATATMMYEAHRSVLKDSLIENKKIKYVSFAFIFLFALNQLLFYVLASEQIDAIFFSAYFVSVFFLTILFLIFLYFNYAQDKELGYIFVLSFLIAILPFSYQLIQTTAGWEMFFYLVLICVLVDSFGLIFGKLLGKHKIAKTISPNKTWEGTIGGILTATIGASLWFIFLDLDYQFFGNLNSEGLIIFLSILLTFTLSWVSFFGDLLFSWVKRKHEIKDYGNLIPGHGGLLDRLDSHILVNFVMIIPIYLVF